MDSNTADIVIALLLVAVPLSIWVLVRFVRLTKTSQKSKKYSWRLTTSKHTKPVPRWGRKGSS